MDPTYRHLPAELLAVSSGEFMLMMLALDAHRRSRPRDRYVAGALAAGQWIAGLTNSHPLRDAGPPCDEAELARCQMDADAVVYRWPGALDIHRSWALGVAAMVGWARGAARSHPLELPGAA
jgi:hypothetical protein